MLRFHHREQHLFLFLGGVRMTYPGAFVLIAQGDLPVEQPPPVPAAHGLSREANHCSVPLTPPTSPEQPCSGTTRCTVLTYAVTCSRANPPGDVAVVTNINGAE